MCSFDMLEGVRAVFINKISNPMMRPNFKGYDYEKNIYGQNVVRFNYPHQNSSVEIYRVEKSPYSYAGYKIADKTPVHTAKIEPNGTVINFDDLNFERGESFAYRIVLPNGQKTPDTGMTIENDYNLVTMDGPKQMVRGSGVLVMPDTEYPGARFAGYDAKNPQEIIIDKDYQKKMEQTVRTHSNQFGGNIAGIIHNIPKYNELGIDVVFSTPIMGADNKSHHHYWNKNNFQLADSMGSLNDYKLFLTELYKNGKVYVDDITLTSEGLEGHRFQYAKKYWAQDPQAMYLFNIGIKDNPIAYGVLPKNDKHLRHRVVNSRYMLNKDETRIIENPKYDSSKPTYYQIYDGRLASKTQLEKDELIERYENITLDDPAEINTYNDTVIPYAIEIKNYEYKDRLEAFLRYKKAGEKIELNSPEGTKITAQFTDDGFSDEAMGGIELWDANVDMAKLAYTIPLTTAKTDFSIVTPEEMYVVNTQRKRATVENIDTAVQVARYRTKLARDTQILYTAQTLGREKVLENISGFRPDGTLKMTERIDKGQLEKATKKMDELIKERKLPERTKVSEQQLDLMIRRINRTLSLKHKLSKDDTTIRALMELPMESLEFGANICEFMTRPFFANKASRDDRFEATLENRKINQVGLTRFELMKMDNPHLAEPYAKTYLKTNLLFKKQVKDFAHSVIEKVNETSAEKLIDKDGNYTFYGEYVIELLGQDIARYAFLKSLAGNKLRAKVVDKNIFYDTPHLRSITTLQGLGIQTSDPVEIAEQLHAKMEKGLDKLNSTDIAFVAEAVANTIKGTTLTDFTVAEVLVKTAGYDQAFRFDAMKDLGSQDAVRAGDEDFRKVWNEVITIMRHIVKGIRSVAEYSGTTAEITDYDDLFRASIGNLADLDTIPDDQGYKIISVKDGMQKIFHSTGIQTEAAYSQTFTDFLRIFSHDFVEGYDGSIEKVHEKLREISSLRTLDYIRNAYTFADNHDKPSVIHGMALNMSKFLSIMPGYVENEPVDNLNARKEIFKILVNSDWESMPIEIKLNINNPRYHNGISPKAVATADLYRDIIDTSLNDVANAEEKALLKEAIKELANGNYLDKGTGFRFLTNDLPQLASASEALKELLADAGLKLPEGEFNEIVKAANREDIISKFYVMGDMDFDKNQDAIDKSKGEITKSSEELDTYVVSLAGLMVAAFEIARGWDKNGIENMKHAANRFINKYDRQTILQNRYILPPFDTTETAGRKNAFATRDFETSIRMMINEAKYIASKRDDLKNKELFKDEDALLVKMFREATEPAIQKTLFYMSFLQAFPGVPTVYMRDVLGALGFEEKSKNIHLQNRNAVKWSQLEEGPLKEYRNLIYQKFKEVLNIRKLDGAGPLNDGAPYLGYTSNSSVPAILRQDAKGNMTVSLFSALGINKAHRAIHNVEMDKMDVNYPETLNIDNPYIPLQTPTKIDYILLDDKVNIPDGTVFENILGSDMAKYVARIFEGKTYILHENANIFRDKGNLIVQNAQIALNKYTSKYGTMTLKHIAHRGRKQTNAKFSPVANTYKVKDEIKIGENLSLIAK